MTRKGAGLTKRRDHERVERSLLSFRHRAALTKTLASAGRGASVVDVRGATGDEIVEAVAFAAAAAGAPLIVIGARGDGAAIDRLIEAGATHHLVAPFTPDDLARALRLADRQAAGVTPVLPRAAADARARIAKRLASDGSGSLLLVAVTRFQAVNTAFGRATGDALLVAAGQRLAALAPAGAIVGRIGGAEFAVMAEEGAEALAARVVERIERPFLAEGHLVSVGCCVGIAERIAGDDAAALLRRAGFALAQARADG
ncbi:MAG: GGDEF domain-containing protein, partial [Sphingomonadaceae bacterium]|nr:GGDEF domain-containing protein [Sphingomonadaceae bacterium]